MNGYCHTSSNTSSCARPSTRLAGAVLALLIAGPAVGQDEQAPAEPPPASILETIGRWLDESRAKIDGQIKNTTDSARDAARDAAEKATTGVVLGWPGGNVVQGRVRCAVAGNGAADCTDAANALCRSKSFTVGKVLDVNTAQKCPTWVWLSGRPAPEGTCTTETFVLRAACQ